jgi:hypothetical protein
MLPHPVFQREEGRDELGRAQSMHRRDEKPEGETQEWAGG